ncbi:FAD-binding oxidoreductase [Algoriphagus halophytocola]|uniref:FAD-binding oxidoreductase n=1 Tax=Algoriphagus halophytocola TaxID=2991499 RepID=A0ABY6MKP6_9BACT|nr:MULTISPECIES: FAD-binding oxidoreductase [unclassified Algoriphagus]UZD22779.1 FAD-binding oxidoreductase [Algoriphagus sp. TR-M5]WBL44045.1 FAD-binding oxidoreductase [Algoriphagus sp. TR-M9]
MTTNLIITMTYISKILEIEKITHDVKQYKVEKPEGYSFIPGQATEVAINKLEWKEEKRPFTFTSLPEADHLEFVIKSYTDHDGVTKQLADLNVGDELILDDSWGAIQYKGKGVFIAGGAGVTPFIGIFKALEAKDELLGNTLIFANKTADDVILESYFRKALGHDFISVLEKEQAGGHQNGMIDKDFLKAHVKDFSQEFYVCGPDKMVQDISQALEELGAEPDAITFEK